MSILLVSALLLVGGLFASPVSADEPGETAEGYLLVQQALAHLAHDVSQEGVALAMEKVDDALSTEDQAGIAIHQLKRARAALAAGQVQQAQALLQSSIARAVKNLDPAVGEETGTTVVLAPMPGRGGLTGADWVLLFASVLLLLAGVALAWFFRPRHNVAELRQRLGPQQPTPAAAPSTTRQDPR